MLEKGGGSGLQKGRVNTLQLASSAFADDGGGHRHQQQKNRRWERTDGEGGDFWQEIHEMSTQVVVFLIAMHIAGVAVSSMVHRENLVLAMLTGRKTAKGKT
jgi:cytochrome b